MQFLVELTNHASLLDKFLVVYLYIYMGRVVGIATDYGLDDPGSNPGGDEIFRPSRPALGSNQLPVR